MKYLLIIAFVLLVLDFIGFGKGSFKKASGILAGVALVVFVLNLLGIILGAVFKIILILLGIYVILRLIIAIKELLFK